MGMMDPYYPVPQLAAMWILVPCEGYKGGSSACYVLPDSAAAREHLWPPQLVQRYSERP